MLQFILYMIPVFIVYRVIRSSWVSNETLKAKYKISRLRDELVWLSISDEIDKHNKEYLHLFENMNKVLITLPCYNFWIMLYVLIKDKNEININEIKALRDDVGKNQSFLEIYENYHKTLITYIARKNIITVLLTKPFWKKFLEARLSSDENSANRFQTEEYSSCAYYFHDITTKSLLLG